MFGDIIRILKKMNIVGNRWRCHEFLQRFLQGFSGVFHVSVKYFLWMNYNDHSRCDLKWNYFKNSSRDFSENLFWDFLKRCWKVRSGNSSIFSSVLFRYSSRKSTSFPKAFFMEFLQRFLQHSLTNWFSYSSMKFLHRPRFH